MNPKGQPASAFVCMNVPVGPGQTVDGNQATHYYIRIGAVTYGRFQLTNPLVKA